MFLHELEPGTVFKLTPAAIKLEKDRQAKMGRPESSALFKSIQAGPFLATTPQRQIKPESGILGLVPAGIFAFTPGHWFSPSPNEQYEVEVIPTPLDGDKKNYLPSREWLSTSCDPEVFLEKGGQIVPGFAVLPTKANPGVDRERGGVFHEDGFQAEFSPPPFACHERVVYSISTVISAMLKHANSQLPITDGVPFKISDQNFVELTPELLNSGTDDQVALGCDRSENVWGHPSFTHDNPREFPYRMAGGHIHLGTVADAKWFHSRADRIIRAMDVFLGVPSVALLAGLEDPRRRQYYGRAGEFRYQKHGLEYRTLSSAWLQHPSLTHLVFNLARGAFRLGTTDWEPLFKYDPEYVRHIINDLDVPAAQKFVEEHAKILIWILNKDSGFDFGAKALTTIHKGAKKTFGTALGIHKSWQSTTMPFHQFIQNHVIGDWGGTPKPVQEVATPRQRGGLDNAQRMVAMPEELTWGAAIPVQTPAPPQNWFVGLAGNGIQDLNQSAPPPPDSGNSPRTASGATSRPPRSVTGRTLTATQMRDASRALRAVAWREVTDTRTLGGSLEIVPGPSRPPGEGWHVNHELGQWERPVRLSGGQMVPDNPEEL